MSCRRFGRLFQGTVLLLAATQLAFAEGETGQSSRAGPSTSIEGPDGSKADSNGGIAPAGDMASLWDSAVTGQIVELSGKVRRVGNEPFTYVVLSDSGGKDWYPDDAGLVLLKPYEQRMVHVRGKLSLKELILANGKKLTPRRILIEITIMGSDSEGPPAGL